MALVIEVLKIKSFSGPPKLKSPLKLPRKGLQVLLS